MAFFYPPPPPSQSASYAPPVPHEPQGSTGDQPPRRQVAHALMMAAALMAWPTDTLEPRLQYPNNQQVKNAAVIPPPPAILYLPSGRPLSAGIVAQWASADADYEVVTTGTLAPENPDAPPVNGPITPTELALVVQAWQPPPPLPVRLPPNAAWNQPPPLQVFLANADRSAAVRAAWVPPDPMPRQLVESVVPALPTGQSAPPIGPITPTEDAQLVAAWPSTVGAQLPYPLATPVRIAPLTLPTGSAPTPTAALPVAKLTTIERQWIPEWPAQKAPPNAAWNIPSIPIVARTPPPRLLWTLWEPPPPLPVRPATIVVSTLPTGTAPPPVRAISNANLGALVSQWVQNWPAQSISPRQDTSFTPTFKPEWAENSNQFLGPIGREAVTH